MEQNGGGFKSVTFYRNARFASVANPFLLCFEKHQVYRRAFDYLWGFGSAHSYTGTSRKTVNQGQDQFGT